MPNATKHRHLAGKKNVQVAVWLITITRLTLSVSVYFFARKKDILLLCNILNVCIYIYIYIQTFNILQKIIVKVKDTVKRRKLQVEELEL